MGIYSELVGKLDFHSQSKFTRALKSVLKSEFHCLFHIYHSLVKEHPWTNRLTRMPKRGWGVILGVLDLTTKEDQWMHIATHFLQIH